MYTKVFREKVQTDKIRDLLDDEFIPKKLNKKYVGRCFGGVLICKIKKIIINSPIYDVAIPAMQNFDQVIWTYDVSFQAECFQLAVGSILVKAVVAEIMDGNHTAILKFSGVTPGGYVFNCEIMATIDEMSLEKVNRIGSVVNIHVNRRPFNRPMKPAIIVYGDIVTQPYRGEFVCFNVNDFIKSKSLPKLQTLHTRLKQYNELQVEELVKRARSIFIDPNNLVNSGTKKFKISCIDGKVSGIDGELLAEADPPHVVYIDMWEPETLTLYLIRNWTNDIRESGLGAHVPDKDTKISSEVLINTYTSYIMMVANNTYLGAEDNSL